jgi:hypothetical protein
MDTKHLSHPPKRRQRGMSLIEAMIIVAAALQAQNFLVVRGDQSCPAAPEAGLFAASLGTVQHQP